MARAWWPVKLSRRPRSVVLEGCQEVWLPPMAAQVFQEHGEAKADALSRPYGWHAVGPGGNVHVSRCQSEGIGCEQSVSPSYKIGRHRPGQSAEGVAFSITQALQPPT